MSEVLGHLNLRLNELLEQKIEAKQQRLHRSTQAYWAALPEDLPESEKDKLRNQQLTDRNTLPDQITSLALAQETINSNFGKIIQALEKLGFTAQELDLTLSRNIATAALAISQRILAGTEIPAYSAEPETAEKPNNPALDLDNIKQILTRPGAERDILQTYAGLLDQPDSPYKISQPLRTKLNRYLEQSIPLSSVPSDKPSDIPDFAREMLSNGYKYRRILPTTPEYKLIRQVAAQMRKSLSG